MNADPGVPNAEYPIQYRYEYQEQKRFSRTNFSKTSAVAGNTVRSLEFGASSQLTKMLSNKSFILLFFAVFVAITTIVVPRIAFGTQQHCSIDPDLLVPSQNESWSISSCDVFSESYDSARQKFRAAVQALPPNVEHRLVSLSIPFDDHYKNYSIDVVVLPGNSCYDSTTGSNTSSGIVIHVSGTHGVEGFAGSAIQIGYLRGLAQNQLETACRSATVLLVHAFNPYGMHHYRRVNEHNVDLNRNGLITEKDWNQVLNGNHYNTENYDTLVAQHLLASTIVTNNHSRNGQMGQFCNIVCLERFFFSWIRMTAALLRYGIPTLKAALVGGQYHVPDGLFFGGGQHHTSIDSTSRSRTTATNHQVHPVERNEPSLIVVREWLETYLMERRRSRKVEVDDECVTWIDVHTGLGPMGIDTLLFGNALRPPDAKHLKHWFPRSLLSSSTVANDDSTVVDRATAADSVQQGYDRVVGFTMDYYFTTIFDTFYNNSRNLFMVQEFGTVPSVFTGWALIVEHLTRAYYSHSSHVVEGNTTELMIQSSKDVLGAAFYPQRTVWRSHIIQRGLHTLQQAIQRSSLYSRELKAAESSDDSTTTIHSNYTDDGLKVEL